MVNALKQWARRLKGLLYAVYYAYKDPRTPRSAKIVAACVLGYAFSPLDLIPDPIPVLGLLDDLILLPLGIALVIRLIPEDVWRDAQLRAESSMHEGIKPSRVAAAVIIGIWIVFVLIVALAGYSLLRP
ncbi:MAG: DUF1232 domain-containing protein [Thermomicrobiales bacterium]